MILTHKLCIFEKFAHLMSITSWSHVHFIFFGMKLFAYKSIVRIHQIRELTAGRKLCEKMMQFKMSVPLMAKLQNDSLRKRHWQHLMEKTGHHFTTNFKEFRLSDMFAMNLYKYQVSK